MAEERIHPKWMLVRGNCDHPLAVLQLENDAAILENLAVELPVYYFPAKIDLQLVRHQTGNRGRGSGCRRPTAIPGPTEVSWLGCDSESTAVELAFVVLVVGHESACLMCQTQR
jgi:hypothetical protein